MKFSSPMVRSIFAYGICLLHPFFVTNAANATVILPVEDARPTTVAVLLTYEFLNDDAFYQCALDWLERNRPTDCENYFDQVSSIASGVKNHQLNSPEDTASFETFSMYVAARDAALPYCPNWKDGDRPDHCFRLITSTIREKWRSDFQKATHGSVLTGKPLKK